MVTKRVCARSVFGAGLVCLAAVVLSASTPRFWSASTQADVLKGEVDRLSIDEWGRLVLGPALASVHDPAGPFVWCLAAAADGTVYAGTGNDGHVIRVDRQGKASIWFDAPEAEVHAIAVAPSGAVYAATSPDGRVYKLDASGVSSVVFDPEDKYIWSLVLDAQGQLFVGTGEKGQVYVVPAAGAARPFYNTSSVHVTSLAFDGQGRLLAGTESPGRVLRIDARGKAFVLVDSPFREIRSLRVDPRGRVFAAAVNGKPASEAPAPSAAALEPPRPTGVPSVSAEITAVTVMDMPTFSAAPSQPSGRRETAATPKGAVYRIDPDGGAETVWESRDDIPYDLLLEGPDTMLVATGNGGKIYRVSDHPSRSTLVARVSSQQATALLRVGTQSYVGASNPARLLTMSAAPAAEGSFVSDVRDAGHVATWGTIAWRAVEGRDGRIQVYTRSGNTATPDEAWSDWAGPYDRAMGAAITSPPARYLQWKVVLSAAVPANGPALASLTVAYLQRNVRPRVLDITVHPPGVVFQRPFPTGEPEIAGLDSALPEYRFPVFSMPLGTVSASRAAGPAMGRRLYQKGLQAFAWRAEDDNEDRLVYDVHFRRVDATEWKPLRLGTLDELITWDTSTVPDGRYVLRVTASDRLSNQPAAVLAGDAQSPAFDVDNTAPSIAEVAISTSGRRSVVAFEAVDAHSVVERVEYAVDAGPWQTVFPSDGAADATREQYRIEVDGPAAGRVVIRVTDAMNNTGTALVTGTPASR